MILDAYEVARIAKESNENVKVALGGPHVTFLPDKTLEECKYADFIVRGEGENTFKELINAIEKGKELGKVKGLSFRGDKTINNPSRGLIKNVDDIPLPSYDLLPMTEYKIGKTEFGTVITSRGCPLHCIFCSSSLQFGKRWRGHSVDRVLRELSLLENKYGKREIEFLDDTFTLNKTRAIEIADRIKKEKMDISWSASSRVDTFSLDVAKAMKKGGAHTIYFGLESGSQKTLDSIGKGITLEKSEASVKIAKETGLHALGSFVIGFPNESREDVNRTIKFSRKVGTDFAQFTIATPYPGTKLWFDAVKEKLLLTMNWREFTALAPVMKLKYFTSSQIARLLQLAYMKFYLRPKIIIKDLINDKGFLFKKAVNVLLPLNKPIGGV